MKAEFFPYIIGFTISLGIFLLMYFSVFKKVRNLKFNRHYLLFALVFSLIVPSIKVNIYWPNSKITAPIEQFENNMANELDIAQGTNFSLPSSSFSREVEATEKNTSTIHKSQTASKISIVKITVWLYLLIGFLLLLHFLIQFIKVSIIVFRSKKIVLNGIQLYTNYSIKIPFTFLRFIVINPLLYTHEELDQVIAHEYQHYRQFHFLELMVVELLKPILWFIPFIWMLDKEIKENHEYLADKGVLSQSRNHTLYQQTLLKGSLGMQYLGISSFLHKSFIKKRITMMNYQNKQRLSWWKLMLLLPTVLISFLACTQKTTNQTSEISTKEGYDEILQLNKTYQFVERTNGYFLCRGTYEFFGVNEDGIWQGIQQNFTQHSTLKITAKVTKDTLEIYTSEPWSETWEVTKKHDGVLSGKIDGSYTLAEKTKMTFELRENLTINELMPSYKPVSKELLTSALPLLKGEKYYWEIWNVKEQTSALSGWFKFEKYDSSTGKITGNQYNYRMQSIVSFSGSYSDGSLTINIGEPWNEIWTAQIENNIFAGEQTYAHNAEGFNGSGIRNWRMSTVPFEDRYKAFEEITNNTIIKE